MKVQLEGVTITETHEDDGARSIHDLTPYQDLFIEPISDDEPCDSVKLHLPVVADSDGAPCTLDIVIDTGELQRAIGYCKDEAKGGG